MDALSRLHPTLAGIVRPERAARVLQDLLADRPAPLLQVWLLVCANLWLRQLGGGGEGRGSGPGR